MLVFFVTIMTTVSSVSEQMHEETAKQEHKREIWRNMLAMVCNQINTCDYEQTNEYPANIIIFHFIFSSALAYKF